MKSTLKPQGRCKIWKDIPYGIPSEDLRHIALPNRLRNDGDVRMDMLMGIARATDRLYRGKRLQFVYRGAKEEGILAELRMHCSEVTCPRVYETSPVQAQPRVGTIYLACTLFLKGTPPYSDYILAYNTGAYMTCNITTLNGRRSDDIFMFLTDIFPSIVCER